MRRVCVSGYTIELIFPVLREYIDMTTEAADIVEFNSAMSAFESKHFSTAIQLLSPFAEKGNADAQHRCAIMFQNGLGVAVNEAKAVEYMTAAAEQGHGVAQHGLGFMYMEGECVEKNAEEALKWFLKAADQGMVGSMTTIAMMYEEGKGVEKNPELAKEWYAKAGF